MNRLDNHIRLFIGCGLQYYVGIDRVTQIQLDPAGLFSEPRSVNSLLLSHYQKNSDKFLERVHVFPNTCVEDLAGIRCQVVVCQRVLPFRHWEDTIKSMRPNLILQEDLNGCELQAISGDLYKKTFPGIIHYGLKPFRPSRFRPGERNIILWRRRDYFPCQYDKESWWKRLIFRLFRI